MRLRLTDPLTGLDRCPQCGTAKPTLNLKGCVFDRDDVADHYQLPAWAIYQCTSCRDAVMFDVPHMPFGHDTRNLAGYINHSFQVYAEAVIPARGHDFSDWPERAATYMTQAVEVISAPDAAVMLAGSAVDAMLKEKGYADGSVYARIEKASKDSILTEAMSDWAHAVRLASNNPRHADLNAPHATPEEAKATIEFTIALGQFLFVLPAKIARGKLAADKAREHALGDGDEGRQES